MRRPTAVLTAAFIAALAILTLAGRGAIVSSVPASAQTPPTQISVPGGSATFTVRRLEGDVNADCLVNINDIQIIANHFGAAFGSLLYSPLLDVNLPQPDGVINIHDYQFVLGRSGSTCLAPIPKNPPNAAAEAPPTGDVTLTKSPSVANIWLCHPGNGDCSPTVPSQLGPADWQNGIAFDEVLTINAPIGGVAEYQFHVTYDPQVFQPPSIVDLGVLNNGGLRTTTCSETDLPGDTLYHCISSGPDGSAVQWTGARSLATVTLNAQPSLLQTLRPAKENGIVSLVQDNGVILGTTGMATATPTTTASPTSTPTQPPATNTPVPTNTAVPTTTNSPVPSATKTVVVSSSEATRTPAGGGATATPSTQIEGTVRPRAVKALPATGQHLGSTGRGRDTTWFVVAAVSLVCGLIGILLWRNRRARARRRWW